MTMSRGGDFIARRGDVSSGPDNSDDPQHPLNLFPDFKRDRIQCWRRRSFEERSHDRLPEHCGVVLVQAGAQCADAELAEVPLALVWRKFREGQMKDPRGAIGSPPVGVSRPMIALVLAIEFPPVLGSSSSVAGSHRAGLGMVLAPAAR